METNTLEIVLKDNFIKTDWQYSLPGTGYETVSILSANGYIYVASNGYVFQLDPHFGTLINKNDLTGMEQHEIRMVISEKKDQLIIGTYGNVIALDANNISTTLWKNNLKGEDTGVVSLVASSQYIYSATGGYVNTMSITDGSIISKNSLPGMGNHEVRLALSEDEKYLIAGINGNVVCLDASAISKDPIWKNGLSGQGEEIVNVLVIKDRAYIGTNGFINSINLLNGDIIETNNLPGMGNHEVRLALSQDCTELFGGINGNIVSMDVNNVNTLQWTTPLPEANGNIVNMITANDGFIYAGSAGRVSQIDPNNGEIITTNNLPGLGVNEVRLSMGPNQTNLYIGSNGYAVGTSELGAFSIKRNKWMEEMGTDIENMQLKQMLIPGTHDSASYGITPLSSFSPEKDLPDWLKKIRDWAGSIPYLSIGAIASLWSKAQGYNIYTQLMGGIRYLDLRLSNRNGDIWLSHSLYSVPIQDVLNDVKRFIASNPKEIIILDFNHLYEFDDSLNKKMATLLSDAFGSKMTNSSQGCDITVGQLWEADQQLLVFYKDDPTCDNYPFLWKEENLCSPYYGATTIDELITNLNNELENFDKDTFFYLHGQLTPDTNMIKDGVIPFNGKPGSLQSLAEETNPKFMDWLKDHNNKKLNIIASDWIFTMTDFVPYCILINKERSSD